MPVYQISAPNGKTYRISGPPGASQQDVVSAVLAQHPDAGEAPGTLAEVGRGLVRSVGTTLGGFAKPIEDVAGKNVVSDWLTEAGKSVSGTVNPRVTPGLAQAWEEGGALEALKSAAVKIGRAHV